MFRFLEKKERERMKKRKRKGETYTAKQRDSVRFLHNTVSPFKPHHIYDIILQQHLSYWCLSLS